MCNQTHSSLYPLKIYHKQLLKGTRKLQTKICKYIKWWSVPVKVIIFGFFSFLFYEVFFSNFLLGVSLWSFSPFSISGVFCGFFLCPILFLPLSIKSWKVYKNRKPATQLCDSYLMTFSFKCRVKQPFSCAVDLFFHHRPSKCFVC